MGRKKEVDYNLVNSYIDQGISRKEIAKIVGCSISTVSVVYRSDPSRGITRQKIDYIVVEKLLREGKTRRQIAKILGCSYEPICRFANSLTDLLSPGKLTKKQIIDLAEQGFHYKQIATKLNLNRGYVKRICYESKISFKLIAEEGFVTHILPENVPTSFKSDELILELREQGLTYKEIVKNFNISENTILRCLRRNGIAKPRKKKG